MYTYCRYTQDSEFTSLLQVPLSLCVCVRKEEEVDDGNQVHNRNECELYKNIKNAF